VDVDDPRVRSTVEDFIADATGSDRVVGLTLNG
jgi:hypothetical protein